ncbi:MAG: corrinoid protein [Acidobacteriia bacterium]|nr:corrinoid protein [Terriglobia bacterium]
MSNHLYSKITASLVDGDPDLTVAATREALAAGIEPLAIIDRSLVPGMRIVGEKFSCGEYFLPNLIVAANGMKQAMQLLEPELRARRQALKSPGTVVIGTVQGDIHEIGKSLVATMLAANGFEVHDLGVDVPVDRFVGTVRETGAELVGLSSLLTTTMVMQKKVVEALGGAGLRRQVKVMVGGAPVSRKWAEEIGADGYAEDAVDAVDLAMKLAAS